VIHLLLQHGQVGFTAPLHNGLLLLLLQSTAAMHLSGVYNAIQHQLHIGLTAALHDCRLLLLLHPATEQDRTA
jgi:hypothetical protein